MLFITSLYYTIKVSPILDKYEQSYFPFVILRAMNTVSRTISGAVIFLVGVVIAYESITDSLDVWSQLWGIGFGLGVCAIGVYLLLHTNEDKIEEITHKEESE